MDRVGEIRSGTRHTQKIHIIKLSKEKLRVIKETGFTHLTPRVNSLMIATVVLYPKLVRLGTIKTVRQKLS